MKTKTFLSITTVIIVLLFSCSLENQNNYLQEDFHAHNDSSRATAGVLPKSTYATCMNNSCQRYRMPLNYTVRTLSRETKLRTITNGADCPKCNYQSNHDVTWTETRYLKKCLSCNYHSGGTLVVHVTKCSLEAPTVVNITGFKVIPHPNPEAPVTYAVWNAVPDAAKYVVKVRYTSTNNTTSYSTIETTATRVTLYKPMNYSVVNIRAYNSRGQLIAKYR